MTSRVWAPVLLVALPALGSDYYAAPSGQDGADGGTPNAPWRSIEYAYARLRPGDRLLLMDGVWNGIDLDCRSDGGVPSAPITIAALNERRAAVHGSGTYRSVSVVNCSGLVLEGLEIQSRDAIGANGEPLVVDRSNDITLRRLLLSKNNRYANDHLVELLSSRRVTLEDSELYDFHRSGVLLLRCTGCVLRGNYVNSRGRPDLAGGYVSDDPTRGDNGIGLYADNTDVVLENNITEGQDIGTYLTASAPSRDVRFLGDISLNEAYGLYLSWDGASCTNLSFENLVTIGSSTVGVYVRSCVDTRAVSSTFWDSEAGLVVDRQGASPPTASGGYSMTGVDLLAARIAGTAYSVSQQQTYALSYLDVFAAGTELSPAAGNFSQVFRINPLVGGCLLYLPAQSPLRGLGSDGGDLGAQVLYRYVDGGLSTQPLWAPGFACGAVVPGINDVPDASCRDVHQRLHVGTADCPLPWASGAGGGSGGSGGGGGASGGGASGGSSPTGGSGGGAPERLSLVAGCGCGTLGAGWWALALVLAARSGRRARPDWLGLRRRRARE